MASNSGRIWLLRVLPKLSCWLVTMKWISLRSRRGLKASFFSFFFFRRRRLRREATRTRKNSSRFEEKMARKLRRSRSGTLGIHGFLEDSPVKGQPGDLPFR